MRTFLTILFIFLVCFTTFSQKRKVIREIEQKGIIYNKEWSIGARLLTHGWEVFGEKSKILNVYKTRIWQFGFSQIKHWKEKKQPGKEFSLPNDEFYDPTRFFFGKESHFFVLRAGVGIRKIIGYKAEKNGVRLSVSYMGGISLGLLIPYYLDLIYDDPNDNFIIVSQKYSEDNKKYFTKVDDIAGASPFRHGLRETEPVPGVYGKVALDFDWGKRDDLVKILEVGLLIDVFYKDIPLFVSNDDKFYFIAALISFQFGKRK